MISAYERLVDPEQMGELFKFFCISEALPEPQAAGPTPASSDNVVHVETDCDAAVDTDSGDDMNTKTKLTGLPPGFVHTRFPDFQVMGGADVQTQE